MIFSYFFFLLPLVLTAPDRQIGQVNNTNSKNFKLTKHLEIEVDASFDKWDQLKEIIESQFHEDSIGKKGRSVDSSIHCANVSSETSVSNNQKTNVENLKTVSDKIDTIYNKLQYFDTLFSDGKLVNENLGYKELCKTLVGTSKLPQCKLFDNIKEANERNGSTKKNIPRSCKEIQENGNATSGIYEIQPKSSNKSVKVLCDMDIRGGGWTHLQKRFDGTQEFFLGWQEYKFGFGDLKGEFWIGLENIYHITGFELNELLVEITDKNKVKAYAHYKGFGIGSESEGYLISVVKGYSGDAGDAMTYHFGQKFTTKDLDQDKYKENCAVVRKGGWWYKECYSANLNGKFLNMDPPQQHLGQGLHWKPYRGDFYSHSASRMLVRPAQG